ncbi:hypothetical protein [Bradyrhizobium sp.]|jgi:hypothetical protein|uniref:hypothetical protein n=1 Tax=Bradyrhizobium sp. TaxID=376 RepID=UPI003C79F93B
MPLNATSFKVGHKYHAPKVPYDRSRLPPRSNKKKLHNIERRIFRALERDRDGELSADQLIHARNAARLGALAEDLFERAKRNEQIDPLAYDATYAALIHRQQIAMELLNE